MIRNDTGSAYVSVTSSFSIFLLTGMSHLSKADKTSTVTTADSNIYLSDSKEKLMNCSGNGNYMTSEQQK